MEEKNAKYGIGDQDFRSLRENGLLYVDKTRYIENMVEENRYYYSQRLYDIIKTASRTSGKRVVILIDDYDKPMIDNLLIL